MLSRKEYFMKTFLKVVSFLALAAALSAAVVTFLDYLCMKSENRYLSTCEEYDDDEDLCF